MECTGIDVDASQHQDQSRNRCQPNGLRYKGNGAIGLCIDLHPLPLRGWNL
jgi:hypothetical protein